MRTKLVIVTDLGCLKAYQLETRVGSSPRLQLLEENIFEGAHQKTSDQVTDSSGAWSAPTHKNWGAPMSEDNNLKLENQRRLIKMIAGHIQRLVQQNGEEGCWLAAPREIHQAILDELPPPARQHIEKSLQRDLVKFGQKDLLEHFEVTAA